MGDWASLGLDYREIMYEKSDLILAGIQNKIDGN
jgi:hypothetical protein